MNRICYCRACGKPIIWIATIAGKKMPCDHVPTPYWERKGATGKVVTPNGEVISCDFTGDQAMTTGLGYIPHFATCPQAERFKNR